MVRGETAMMLTSSLVGAEVKGSIGWLIWDNQSKLNALSPGMYPDALAVIEAFEADPAVKVVVMRGAGNREFISCADISSFEKTRSDSASAEHAELVPEHFRQAMQTIEKPLIA